VGDIANAGANTVAVAFVFAFVFAAAAQVSLPPPPSADAKRGEISSPSRVRVPRSGVAGGKSKLHV
jgi:hypothetical protein